MMVENLFQWLDAFKSANMVRAAFGEPYEAAGRTVIPVARVSYSLRAEGEEGTQMWPHEGRASAKPVAVISVGSDGVRVDEITDRSFLALVGAGLLALASVLTWRFRQSGRG